MSMLTDLGYDGVHKPLILTLDPYTPDRVVEDRHADFVADRWARLHDRTINL